MTTSLQVLPVLHSRVQIMLWLHNAYATATEKTTTDLVSFSRQVTDAVAKMGTLTNLGPDDDFIKALQELQKQQPAVVAFCASWQQFKASLATASGRRPSAAERDKVLKALNEAIAACAEGESRTKMTSLINATLKTSASLLSKFYPDAKAQLDASLVAVRVQKARSNQPYGYSGFNSGATTDVKVYEQSSTRELLVSIKNDVETNQDVLPIDPTKATWADYLRTVYPGVAAGGDDVSGYIGLPALYARVGTPLTAWLNKTAGDLAKGRDEVPARQSAELAKLAGELGELVKEVTALAAALSATIDYTTFNFPVAAAPVARRVATMLDGRYATILPRGDGKPGPAWLKGGPGAPGGFGSVTRGFSASGSSYESEGLLYRAPDVQRMVTYVETLKHFRKSLETVGTAGAVLRVSSRVTGTIKDLSAKMAGLANRELETVAMQRDGLVKQRFSVLRSYIDNVRDAVSRFRRVHGAFALNHNRTALRYMSYWNGVGVKGPAEACIKEYYDLLKAVLEDAAKAFADFQGQVRGVFADGSVMQGVSDQQAIELDELRDGLAEFIDRQADRVQGYHTVVNPSLLELVDDPQFLVLYALKALRFGLACCAITIASRAFLAMYTERVYARQQEAPSPLLFLAMVVGIELAMGVAVFGVLFFVKSTFSGTSDFPVDAYLLRCWAIDVALTTSAVAVLGVGLAQVIASKKYFRYMQEGDRAIRALSTVLRYEYGVFLALPFFRLASG
jgi:hypothetical protein